MFPGRRALIDDVASGRVCVEPVVCLTGLAFLLTGIVLVGQGRRILFIISVRPLQTLSASCVTQRRRSPVFCEARTFLECGKSDEAHFLGQLELCQDCRFPPRKRSAGAMMGAEEMARANGLHAAVCPGGAELGSGHDDQAESPLLAHHAD